MALIGAGVIILCVVWAITILVCALLLRCEGPLTYLSLVVLTIALLLTVVLWVIFKQDQQRKLEGGSVVCDYSVVGRTVVFAVTGTGLLIGLLTVFVFHLTVPRRASRLPPWSSVFE